MGNSVKNNRGFTLVELILTMTLLAILSYPVIYLLNEGTRSYGMMFSRVEASQSVNAGLQRVKDELVLLKSSNLTQISANQISFRDTNNLATNFRFQSGNMYRGNDLLLKNVQSLTFTYKDQNNATTATIANVRRIGVDLRVIPAGATAAVVYQMEVFPRNFMYQSFQ